MYPSHIQEVVSEAQRDGGSLSRFSGDELSDAYLGLGTTSTSPFGLKIKAEIDQREKSKASRNASYIRTIGYIVALALTIIAVLRAK